MGDPRGIGPEVAAKALKDPPAEAEFSVIGPSALIEALPATPIAIDADAEPNVRLVGAGSGRSMSAAEAGKLTGRAVEKAVALALAGKVDAVVTGPAEKRALHLAGYRYPGHTEWLAALAGGVDAVMMLTAEQLRVALVTTHIPLREVVAALSTDRVVTAGRVTLRSLRDWWKIDHPRLALCAINPHAGESGLFGSEEQDILAPAAEALGGVVLPADTVFVRALRGEFDAVLAPYHDVGMTAIKVASFGAAVNVTLGLPFVRTSPDHGTAFDIAGTNRADPGSMRAAIALAARLAMASEG